MDQSHPLDPPSEAPLPILDTTIWLLDKDELFLALPSILPFRKSGKPDFRIRMNREGTEKNYTCQSHIWTTISVTDKFWFGPSFKGLQYWSGLVLLNFTKQPPIRVGHTKIFIKKESNFIYDFGK